MFGYNLWLYLLGVPQSGKNVVGIPAIDYDIGGVWTFFPNGVGNGGDTVVNNPSDTSLDGITAQNLNPSSVFQYCVGTGSCKRCTTVTVDVSDCALCSSCQISLIDYDVECLGGGLVRVCASIQANPCANNPNGNQIQFAALLDDGSGTYPFGGFTNDVLKPDGSLQTICIDIPNVSIEIQSINFELVYTNDPSNRDCFQETIVPGGVYPNATTPICA